MTDDREDKIRARAYEIWQREGSEDGVALDHWVQAQEEVDAEPGADTEENTRDPDNLENRPPPPS
jgi:hypothetical protein